MSWLIAGLGNPGAKYHNNRHNIGFMVVDELARRWGVTYREKFKGFHGKGLMRSTDIHLLKPQTFMNVSGVSVGAAASFFKQGPENVIVIHDELDLDYGVVRLKRGGGHAGHNGLRSIFSHYGKDFARVRVGIGRPRGENVTSHVLGDFSKDELPQLGAVVDLAADAVERVVEDGLVPAMNDINQR